MRAPTILLVSPAFHGYWKAIEASLNVAGYEVRTHIYDAPGTVADRICNKLAHELPEKYDFGEGLEVEGTPLFLQEGATSMLVSRFF